MKIHIRRSGGNEEILEVWSKKDIAELKLANSDLIAVDNNHGFIKFKAFKKRETYVALPDSVSKSESNAQAGLVLSTAPSAHAGVSSSTKMPQEVTISISGVEEKLDRIADLSKEQGVKLEAISDKMKSMAVENTRQILSEDRSIVAQSLEELRHVLKLVIAEQSQQFCTAVDSFRQMLNEQGVEASVRSKAEEVLSALVNAAEQKLAGVTTAVGNLQDAYRQSSQELTELSTGVRKELEELRQTQDDINEDQANLRDRIKRYGLGHVTVLEQENETLTKQLATAQAERNKYRDELLYLKRDSGQYDPELLRRVLQENAELKQLVCEYEVLKIQHKALNDKYEALAPEIAKWTQNQIDTREVAELRRYKEQHDEALRKAEETAREQSDLARDLRRKSKELTRELQDLSETKSKIEELVSARDEARHNAKVQGKAAEDLRKERDQLQAELREKTIRLDERYQTVEKETEVARSQAVNEARLQGYNEAEDASADEKKRLQASIDRLVDTVQTLEAECASHVARCKELGKREQELECDIANANRLLAELGNLPAEYSNYEGLIRREQELKARINALELEYQTSEQSCKERVKLLETDSSNRCTLLQRKVDDKEQQLVDVENELQLQRTEYARVAGELQALQRQLDRSNAEIDLRNQRRGREFLHLFEKGSQATEPENESDWLRQIHEKIKNGGFSVSHRLLNAFHTSLKAQDISPITLLVGISGTGKSELPRLYADHGGLYFLNIAVQPNWDSPMDLFGFFNYTDGFFRSTQLSRALCQFVPAVEGKRPGEDHCLEDRLLLVLLDEMNLARVEYYFSDLLSKLESRRSVLLEENPSADQRRRASVELDLGTDKLSLYLAPNVLFCGTLNQDESTLDVSDKVIDRANVITFPRPRHFAGYSRQSQGAGGQGQKLVRESWEKWCNPETKRMKEIESKLQEEFAAVNDALSKVQRGIGHRVFQAVLKYIAAYPVKTKEEKTTDDMQAPRPEGQASGTAAQNATLKSNAFNDAIEKAKADQYAMKILPKLKGIDKSSKSGAACISEIRRVVPDELKESFDKSAMEDIFEWHGAVELFHDET